MFGAMAVVALPELQTQFIEGLAQTELGQSVVLGDRPQKIPHEIGLAACEIGKGIMIELLLQDPPLAFQRFQAIQVTSSDAIQLLCAEFLQARQFLLDSDSRHSVLAFVSWLDSSPPCFCSLARSVQAPVNSLTTFSTPSSNSGFFSRFARPMFSKQKPYS